jgi:hypothetical protein
MGQVVRRYAAVLLGHSGAHVPAGKVTRDDVAELITLALFYPGAANATLGIAGAVQKTGGIKTEMSWDPARGMHYRAVRFDTTLHHVLLQSKHIQLMATSMVHVPI